MSPALVIGLGRDDRADDGFGPAVAEAVSRRGLPGVSVLVHEDPTALIDLWHGRDLVVVVDAVRSGAPAGTLHRLVTSEGGPPLAPSAWAAAGRGGTHAFGLAEAVELGRALHRLPARLVVVGVEAERLDHGAPLSPPVAAAVGTAVAQVLEELDSHVPR